MKKTTEKHGWCLIANSVTYFRVASATLRGGRFPSPTKRTTIAWLLGPFTDNGEWSGPKSDAVVRHIHSSIANLQLCSSSSKYLANAEAITHRANGRERGGRA